MRFSGDSRRLNLMSQGQFQFEFQNRSDPERSAAQARSQPSPRVEKAAGMKSAAQKPHIYSVTQLTRLIKHALSDTLPQKVILEAEISNFRRHGSGHLYLSLKDEQAVIPAVMWKAQAGRLKFDPADGLAVVATGRVDVYEPHGKYQFYIDKLEPAGVGALELAFRQLAEKLRVEGLFDPARKRPIPQIPSTIAILTAEGSAALEDIRKTLARRYRIARKLLFAVPVQGEGAAAKIAQRLNEVNRRAAGLGGIDLIILARGGGSLEDLWAFNEEVVARAIAASAIPIITGIGHEVDTTIADLVSDLRTHTPTAAAEAAVPALADLYLNLQQQQRRLERALAQQLVLVRRELERLSGHAVFARPAERLYQLAQTLDQRQTHLQRVIAVQVHRARRQLEDRSQVLRQIEPHRLLGRRRQQLSDLVGRLKQATHRSLQRDRQRLLQAQAALHGARPAAQIQRQQELLQQRFGRLRRAVQQRTLAGSQNLEHWQSRLLSLDPRNILKRGYSITRDVDSGRIIQDVGGLKPGQRLLTELRGERSVESKVVQVRKQKKGEQ